MERMFLKNMGVSALGALIGAFISLQMVAFVWPLGALVGGLFAYLGSDLAGIRYGYGIARQKAISWRPDVQYWKACGILALAGFLLMLTVAPPVIYLVYKPEFRLAPYLDALNGDVQTIWAFTACWIVSITVMYICAAAGSNLTELKYATPRLVAAMKVINPIAAPFWLAFWVLKATVTIAMTVPSVARALWKFTSTLFVEIHSDDRLMCGSGGALGAGVGFYSGNALIGAVAGGAIFLLSNKLIAKRLLKINPK